MGSKLHKAHGILRKRHYNSENHEFVEELYVDEGRFYQGYRLKVSEAPEPNDVNWEFINTTNFEKVVARFWTYLSYFGLLLLGFGVIFLLKYYQSKYLDEAIEEFEEAEEHHEKEKKEEAQSLMNTWSAMTYVVVILIICFNKFFVGIMMEKIVE